MQAIDGDARDGAIDLFLRSMPSPYAHVFERSDVVAHARIVAERGDKVAHVALWRSLPGGGAALCVVADDRPGLLAHVTAAFGAHQLDVMSAQIFCRTTGGGTDEAVDFFWLRPLRNGRVIGDEDIALVANTLRELLLDDELERDSLKRPSTIPAGPASGTRVYFDVRALQRGESVLMVETKDTPGLLFAITSELYRQGVEVVASDVRTHGQVAFDRFTLTDAEGRALSGAKLAEVQQGVRRAVRALVPGSLKRNPNLI
ncbi:MAG TPA: ACT domain-containing protein [Polyangiaceae bacterium]|nr:ACT domain-containing protein [Polyangiaceae bacterium]